MFDIVKIINKEHVKIYFIKYKMYDEFRIDFR